MPMDQSPRHPNPRGFRQFVKLILILCIISMFCLDLLSDLLFQTYSSIPTVYIVDSRAQKLVSNNRYQGNLANSSVKILEAYQNKLCNR